VLSRRADELLVIALILCAALVAAGLVTGSMLVWSFVPGSEWLRLAALLPGVITVALLMRASRE
jgi:hypothetical protein